jgi:alkane 1-monooxygenase
MLMIRNMTKQMRLFAIATLMPVGLLVLAATIGGIWVLGAVLYLTALTSALDRMISIISPSSEFPSGDGLSILLACAHFGLMPLVVLALAGDALTLLEKLGLFFAAGLFFGQVSNANAHELIHRSKRWLHQLGMWVYVTMLFGHHTSATAADPNTSRKGESFYRYAIRAWVGSFKEGYKAEATRLARINRPAWRNPYLIYVGGAILLIVLAFWAGGAKAALLYILLAGHAQTQLLMSDYVQHYGLERATKDGRPEPVSSRHSWNSPHYYSSALMLNATRHSDHHAHPARAYPALTLPKDAPMLPKPLPLMASIALIPPLWRRIMDPRTDRWRNA